ncbi:hypothetical protein N656DRAFT_784059 [Canariomyces notabilis]|uniref:Ubiquitin-like domain-containing protein n=1 Tax=Canariomyces notabilis TaxID=2074819 RepID=A0AAN6T7Z7_9PEZI|nr:hypothetical protein N656DRAFT_784059 [Canariomyces arenarius]
MAPQRTSKERDGRRHKSFPRSLTIGEESELDVAIYRTERVLDAIDPELQPVTNKVTRLGSLPLLPRKKGIYEAAVRQTDALAVHITSPHRFKVKILVGAVNVANPVSQHGQQDYYVSDLQEWVDGVYIGDNRVRQFVALPSGTGHSIANQVKRLEDTGEFEIQVFTPRGIHLDDQNRLRYCKARPTPIQNTGHGFFVIVRTAKNTNHIVGNLRETDPIWHLKACIQDVLGVSGLKQELAFLGEDVSDHKTLSEYGIEMASSLVLTTAGDDPVKKATARAEGGIVEMLRKINKEKARLDKMKEDLDTAKFRSADFLTTATNQLEKGKELAQRVEDAMKELKQLETMLGRPRTPQSRYGITFPSSGISWSKWNLDEIQSWGPKVEFQARGRIPMGPGIPRRPANPGHGHPGIGASFEPRPSGRHSAESRLKMEAEAQDRLKMEAEAAQRSRRRRERARIEFELSVPDETTRRRARERYKEGSRDWKEQNKEINVAPGGRIAQTVERDPDRHRDVWNDKPIQVWRVKIVDFDIVREASGLPSLPRLKPEERLRRRDPLPSLDKTVDNSGLASVAQREAEHPSAVPFGVFAVRDTLPPVGGASSASATSAPTIRNRGGPGAGESATSLPAVSNRGGGGERRNRQALADPRPTRARRADRERKVARRGEGCLCVCM